MKTCIYDWWGWLWCLVLLGACADAGHPPEPATAGRRAVAEWYQQGRQQAAQNLTHALSLIQRGISQARQQGWPELEADGNMHYAAVCQAHGQPLDDLRVAVNCYLEAATLYEDLADTLGAARAHFKAGVGFLQFKDHEQAISYLLKALARYERLPDSLGMLQAHLRLSDAFWGNGAWSVSWQYAREAEQLARDLDQRPAEVASLLRQSEYFLKEQEYARTETLLLEALARQDTTQASALTINSLNRLAAVHMLRQRPRLARQRIEQALQRSEQAGYRSGLAEALGLKAAWLMQAQQYRMVPAYLDSSLTLARRLRLADLYLTNQQRYLDYLMQTNRLDALSRRWPLYQRIRDSLEQVEQRDLTQRLQAQFEVARQAYQIGLLEEQRKTQAAELTTRRYQVQFAAAIGLLLLLLAAGLYQQYSSKRRINQQLERLVARRTEELRHANHDLKEVNQELDTFAYRTAHDIRGPVARLLGLCQLVLHGNSDGDMRRYLELIYQETIQMDFMLHRFLEVNNIKHHPRSAEPVNLRACVEEVLAEMGDLEAFPHLAVSVDVEPELELVADPMLVRIVLKNLIENAILFSRKEADDGFVDIQAHSSNGHLELRVLDNGIGIAPQVASRVFEMFFRGTTASKGLGLGLYATQLATHALGGTVRYHANNQHATEFIVQIPKTPLA